MKHFLFRLAILFLFASRILFAQNAPPSPLFACATDAVGVRLGSTTSPGTDVNCSFNVTKAVAVETHNILVPSTGGQDYFAGVSWTPDFSKLFSKTNLPKNTFQPFIHGAVGAARTVPSSGPTLQHYGAFAGAGVRYDPTGSRRFTITPVRFDWYNHPGIAKGPHGWLVGAGIQFVFGQK